MKKSYYRSDIDGLRALAIIPVILFHYGISGFSGGFVGVDIFFVISGYLITSIILRELRENRFSLVKFWERRFRRITPALFTVLLCTTIAGYFVILFPIDFKDFGWTLIAQSMFLANFWFMRADDYFAAPSETIPLLHTWSLAVEEQFYFVFPLLMLSVFVFKRSRPIVIIGILALASLAYSVYLTHFVPLERFTLPLLPHLWGGATNESASFYFIAPRAWELLLGALVAITTNTINSKRVAEAVSLLGVGMVVYSVTNLSQQTAFPGALALIPTTGTALIILAQKHHQTFTKGMLSFPIFVGIGLISYPLYLWHWPLLVFTKYRLGEVLEKNHIVWLLALTLTLSVITYFFIEKPFRSKQLLHKPVHMIAGGFLMLLLLLSSGVFIIQNQGLSERAPLAAQAIANAATDFNPRRAECFTKTIADITNKNEPCLLGLRHTDNIDFVLWGDSHADAVMPAFDEYGKLTNQTGIFFGVGGCVSLLYPESITKDENCQIEKHRAVDFIKHNIPKKIFLVSNWSSQYETKSGDTPSLTAMLAETVAHIPKETQIIVMRPIPTFPDYDVRASFIETSLSDALPNKSLTLSEVANLSSPVNSMIDLAIEDNPNLLAIDPKITLCADNECYLNRDGVALYRDGSHLTTSSALLYVLPLITQNR